MKPSTYLLAALLLPTSLGLVACGGDAPAPPADVQARISSDLGNVLAQTKAASDAGTSGLPMGSTIALLERLIPGTSSTTVVAGLLPRPADGAGGSGSAGSAGSLDPDAIIQELNTKLFTDANYQGDGIYAVPAELVCSSSVTDENGNTTTAIAPDCASNLAASQLRIHVTEAGSELAFAVQVDAAHDEPVSIRLTHTSLGLTLDLDGASRAITALAPIFGATAPNAELSGQVSGELEILGAAHLRASLTIDRDLAIAVGDTGVDLTGDAAARFTSAAASVLSIELDGSAASPTAQLDVAVAATTAHIPGNTDEGTVSEDLDLPGMTASATLSATGVAFSNLGLGDRTTTLTRGGQRAVAIDLNPSDGRSLAASLATSDLGVETLTVSPKLDLHLAIDHAALGDSAPAYDVSQVLLTGGLASTETSTRVTGELKIVTTPAHFGIDATAGQCVTASDETDPVTGSTFTAWVAGTCE